ncbi:uncharacterized protein LOC106055980 isoform X1 [Biomphalaria glabrata]|uniref:Uncharacterized protein LOC106055980 isoform X1 n=1 Tax=Biomphalaria glabrata TaxID=6526 RepID=A0A9W2YJ26_BIOGL|nr:uncharacterized protein LOC106055980 isoform X1 [Biomphalaria glabrata]XP_055862775.1 uncharacterized protein LOC106055980 isoform X1 [Biomphalaria glabrata]XP_055862776.1 uncharacterized protein LOC106055980 isoform X1 [Biomphalaria glabrata]XP_055862777.1 uncharacterized protein LOC106055980 isoform X1 [Biomphalaria glabrata]XP_055862778.1 uncharacterized protein LOC106055980 isoform X1 [Biomphalaria glabrata]XP_055862779.1 uncharacterized protein LOC106055980 isoform X1 [Biomphalaria gla
MAMITNHEDLYKRGGAGDISSIKASSKITQKSAQSKLREKIITNKRFKVESLELAEVVLSEVEEKEKVENSIKKLKHGRNVEALTTLYRSFARDWAHAETFIKCEGLPLLQGCFLSTDAELLHAAAWCAVNLSAGQSKVVKKVMCLSPTLIQFLSGSDRVMQELCAWALANLAGDSQRNKQILLEQGCVTILVTLVATKYYMDFEDLLKSVLFALVNLAKDETYACVRCMQESSIYSHIVTLLTDISANCDLCYEIGWLLNCLYSRQETLTEYYNQLSPVLHLIVNKLSQFMQIENKSQREKVLLPYVHCVGNIIGQKLDLAVVLCQEVQFYTWILTCLQCSDLYIQSEVLWLVNNFMVEPSCRVLIIIQSNILSAIFNLCHSSDVDIALQSLHLVQMMTKVSTFILTYLVHQGLVGLLILLVTHHDHRILQTTLDLLVHLVSVIPQEVLEPLSASGVSETLQHLRLHSSDLHVQTNLQSLLSML